MNHFFIFGYVETALTECVALSTAAPVPLIGDNRPAAAISDPAVAGAIHWKNFDSVNGNSFVYSTKKVVLISNTDAADDVIVTINTKDDTVNGFARTVANMTINLAAGEMCLVPFLPGAFKDGTLVTLSIAEDGGTAITDTYIAVVEIGS